MRNIKLKYFCLGLLFLCFIQTTKAQHDPQFSQFMFNKILYNPGFTGIDEVLNASFMGRNQWMGFDGQPVTQSVCVDAPIPTGGLGLIFSNDVLGAQQTTSFTLNYAFRLMLDDGGSFAFGLSVGYLQNTLNGSIYRAPDGSYEGGNLIHNDDYIPTTKVSAGAFDLGLGVYLNMKNLYAGLSVTHILNPTTQFDIDMNTLNIEHSRNIYLMGGYNFELNNTMALRPSLLVKTDLIKTQVDLNAHIVYEGNLWGGVSYRGVTANSSDALILLGGINITNQISIGYSYDMTTSGIRNYSSGSHELIVKYKLLAFGKKGAKLIYCPRFL